MTSARAYWPLFVATLLLGCENAHQPALPGYVEVEYTRLASPVAGRLIALKVQRGQEVASGAALFTLDQDQENAAVEEANAHLDSQSATAADLGKGKRNEEISAIEAQERQASAQASLSEADLARQKDLAARGFVSAAALDTYQSRYKADVAKLAEVRANLQVARLAARQDTRRAADANVAAARAVLAQNQWKRDQKSINAPAAGRIDDTLYREGEWVPAGSPVVSLLTPDAVKLRFFVPQEQLARFAPGTRVRAQCDGCGAPFNATVSYVAKTAEFNPPVIYSQENRARMVFLVEAKPVDNKHLSAGQPVDILLDGAP